MSVYEPLFYDHQVDLVLSGHVHAYERCGAGDKLEWEGGASGRGLAPAPLLCTP